uniref:Uncharacterized protein n=1 Tax=Fagus sylvatica TaxID=28930 RepID=A0A2N9HWP8_FAGSY
MRREAARREARRGTMARRGARASGSRGLRGGFLVDSGGGLIHSGLGSVARLFAVGLWGGLPR